MACHCGGQSIVCPPRKVDAFWPEVMKRRGSQRQDLNVNSSLIHQSEPFLRQSEQASLDRIGMEPDTGIDGLKANGIPRVSYFRCQEMPLLYRRVS